jgi:glutaredoxin 3
MAITIYTTAGCPYCARAKSMLDSERIPYIEHMYQWDTPQMDALIARTRHQTVPQVFFGNRFIGGSDELYNMIRSGEINRYR